MRTLRIQAIVLGILYLCFLGSMVLAAQQLPDRVASHFNGGGQPDGWMSRSAHLLFMSVFGFAFPLFIVGICSVLRFLPASIINVTHRDYWLAPERQAETFTYLIRHSLWFACMAVGFVIGLHLLIIQANIQPLARLSTPMILGLAGCFLAGVTVWVVSMLLHFGTPHSAEKMQR